MFSEEVSNHDYAIEIIVDREREKQLIKEYLEDVLQCRKRPLYIHHPDSEDVSKGLFERL